MIAVLAGIFAAQNTAQVTVSFLFWQFKNSLAVVLLLAILSGALISIFASLPGWLRNRVGQVGQKKKVKELEASLARLGEKFEAAQQELSLFHAAADEEESRPAISTELTKKM